MASPRLLLPVLFALAAPASASAELPWQPCQPAGYQCAGLDVPLDRSGATPGVVKLAAKRLPAATNPGRIAAVGIAGGPGQAAIPIAPTFARDLAGALASRDLLVLDQRGTGSSNPLDCASLLIPGTGRPTQAEVDQATSGCAAQLGPARAFFRTADSVRDLEALRVAGGYEKLALYGVSYGTKVAMAYASAFPARVESLVLDSVVTPEGPDALRRPSLAAIDRVLEEICADGRCRGITAGASRDVRTLAARLRRQRLTGSVYSASGRRSTARLGEGGLYAILLAGDLNPTLRAELPGSVRAALAGDAKPILRLSDRSAGLSNRRGYQSSQADSFALFLATTCEENATFPWARDATLVQKRAAGRRAAAALSPAARGPFSPTAVLEQSVLPLCQGWPVASPPPAPDAALPAVPTLLLDGRQDLRTPLQDARAVADRIPGARLVGVPHVGHSVLGADLTSCARDAVAAFYAGTPVAECTQAAPRFRPTPRPPTRASRLEPYGGVKGKPGRTVEALRMTVNDAQRQVLGEAIALGAAPAGAGGLRSGSVRVRGSNLQLRRYEYVPGVLVTGTILARGTSTFRVSGPQASGGVVRVTQTLGVSGTLGGRRVSTRFGRAAGATLRPYGGLTLRQAVARGARLRTGV